MTTYRLKPNVLAEAKRTNRRMLTTIDGEHISFYPDQEHKVTIPANKSNPEKEVRTYKPPTQELMAKLMEENANGWSWIIEEAPSGKSDTSVKSSPNKSEPTQNETGPKK